MTFPPLLSFNPPSGYGSTPPPRARFAQPNLSTPQGPKAALRTGFSSLQVSPQPEGSMPAEIETLDVGFETPTPSRSSFNSRISQSARRPAPKSVETSLGPSFSTAETPRPRSTARVASMASGIEADTASPMNLDSSFHLISGSTPRFARGLSPKSSPSRPAVADVSVMSINSPTASLIAHEFSSQPSVDSDDAHPVPEEQYEQHESDELLVNEEYSDVEPYSTEDKDTIEQSQPLEQVEEYERGDTSNHSNEPEVQEQVQTDGEVTDEEQTDGQAGILSNVLQSSEVQFDEEDEPQAYADPPSPSDSVKVNAHGDETCSLAQSSPVFNRSTTDQDFQSPTKVDTTMHDVTMISEFGASPRKMPQTYTFASIEPTKAAQDLCVPFKSEMHTGFDYSSTLAAPHVLRSVPRPVNWSARRRERVLRLKQRRKAKDLLLDKMIRKDIAQSVAKSLELEELEAASQFRFLAIKDNDLAYALCPRKRQRVAEDTEDDHAEPYWLEVSELVDGVNDVIEGRRVLRNQLFALRQDSVHGPTVGEQRRQYHADIQKHGQSLIPTCGKRNYDGEPKRAFNNGLLTNTIMKGLLVIPGPDILFEYVYQAAVHDAERADGRLRRKIRNVRQHVAIFGEPEVSVIEEEEEPESPTRKLPHFPSTATHQSNASRKARLVLGADVLRSRIDARASPEVPAFPTEPLSSPIGPGFTFNVPSCTSSPSFIKANFGDQETQNAESQTTDLEQAPASPMVVFKDRTQPQTAFKKRRSLPAGYRLTFASPLRRASLPAAISVDQRSAVQSPSFEVDSASGPPAVATHSPEHPAVQSPLVVDSASAAVAPGSPTLVDGASAATVESASPTGSPAPVVVDVRENPDIFGSFQDRPGSPIQALASLSRVFEDAREKAKDDAKVVVTHEEGRLIVRFKLPNEYTSLFAGEEEAAQLDAASPVPAPNAAENEKEEEEEEVEQVPTLALPAEQEDERDLLRRFMSRHAARAKAVAERAAPLPAAPAPLAASPVARSTAPLPSVPILPAATPERQQGVFANTPSLSVASSTERHSSPRRVSSVASSTVRQPLGALDVNSPSPRKAKRKADNFEEPEASPQKPEPKRPRRAKADKPEKPEADDAAVNTPAPRVRTRRQLAIERGEEPPATKIPIRPQRDAKKSEGKDLAALTRANTRTNKGSAVPADQMLETLKNSPSSAETTLAAASKKDGKSVQWAERLARSQSEERFAAASSPAEQVEVPKATRGRPKGTRTAATKAAAAAPKTRQPAASGPKTEGTKVAKRKVTPAAKKEIGQSANGTPAPAKRSRRIAEMK
ncbi:hypothetical protein CCHL11_08551 [Colletotrichum chlorophyti]|uniref:Uncharacterized protein n=1 Tax=Colletotrichum chlorophyti TaxID=708187 RepID=A0A1Q8RAS8_9PEZI|nr:hypothetical protein CCHL11_08551 [Colletotrichum chlorophyti]